MGGKRTINRAMKWSEKKWQLCTLLLKEPEHFFFLNPHLMDECII